MQSHPHAHRLRCAAPLALAASTACALAAPGAPPVGAAIAAPFEDSIAQRMQACVTGHGDKGGGMNGSAFPWLAGQPADYLAAPMRAFRDARRIDGTRFAPYAENCVCA